MCPLHITKAGGWNHHFRSKSDEKNTPPKNNGQNLSDPEHDHCNFYNSYKFNYQKSKHFHSQKIRPPKTNPFLISKIFQPTKHFRMVAVVCDASLVTKGTSRLGKKSDLPGKGVHGNSSRKNSGKTQQGQIYGCVFLLAGSNCCKKHVCISIVIGNRIIAVL